MDKAQILKDIHDRLDFPGLFSDCLDKILEPALQKIVSDTSNTLDDALMRSIYPQLEAHLKTTAKLYWDKLAAS